VSANLAPPPLQSAWSETPGDIQTGRAPVPSFLTRVAGQWLLSLTTRLQTAASAVVQLILTGQAASIAATDLIPVPATGLYRITYRIRVTQAATVSSSILLTLSATDGGVACAMATAAYVGNVTNAPQTGTLLLRTDAGSPITYATTYASVGATAMVYEIDLVVEAL
jgi:hypothetical protein